MSKFKITKEIVKNILDKSGDKVKAAEGGEKLTPEQTYYLIQ